MGVALNDLPLDLHRPLADRKFVRLASGDARSRWGPR